MLKPLGTMPETMLQVKLKPSYIFPLTQTNGTHKHNFFVSYFCLEELGCSTFGKHWKHLRLKVITVSHQCI
jgi:hypothetical protein